MPIQLITCNIKIEEPLDRNDHAEKTVNVKLKTANAQHIADVIGSGNFMDNDE